MRFYSKVSCYHVKKRLFLKGLRYFALFNSKMVFSINASRYEAKCLHSRQNFCVIKRKYQFLCRLRSIATHMDHFVRRPSVCPSVRPSVCLSVRLSHFPKLCFAGDTCIPRNAATIFYTKELRYYIFVFWRKFRGFTQKFDITAQVFMSFLKRFAQLCQSFMSMRLYL